MIVGDVVSRATPVRAALKLPKINHSSHLGACDALETSSRSIERSNACAR